MRNDFEFMKQARLADSGFANRSNDLAVTGAREFQRAIELRHLGIASDEFRQPAPRRCLEARPQRSEADHFINIDQLAEPFDPGGAERLQLEISFDEAAGVFCYRDCTRRR